jgi:hypothetical protein
VDNGVDSVPVTIFLLALWEKTKVKKSTFRSGFGELMIERHWLMVEANAFFNKKRKYKI